LDYLVVMKVVKGAAEASDGLGGNDWRLVG